MYPKVFEDYKKFVSKYGDLSVLPTKYFLARPEINEEFHVELQKGKVLILKLLAVGPLSEQTGQREVFYEMNGEVRQVAVEDKNAAVENLSRPKADTGDSSQVGAPMSGVVVEVRVHDGGEVKKGDPIAVLSAMKMVRSFLLTTTAARPDADSHNRRWSSARHTLVPSQVCWSRRVIRSIARISCVRSLSPATSSSTRSTLVESALSNFLHLPSPNTHCHPVCPSTQKFHGRSRDETSPRFLNPPRSWRTYDPARNYVTGPRKGRHSVSDGVDGDEPAVP